MWAEGSLQIAGTWEQRACGGEGQGLLCAHTAAAAGCAGASSPQSPAGSQGASSVPKAHTAPGAGQATGCAVLWWERLAGGRIWPGRLQLC